VKAEFVHMVENLATLYAVNSGIEAKQTNLQRIEVRCYAMVFYEVKMI
jgi:hypothetical protein